VIDLKSGTDIAPADIPTHLRRPRLLVGEASQYLLVAHGVHVAVATLRKMRTTGGGPIAQKFAQKLLYRPADLDSWVAARIGDPSRSTSE